MPSPVDVGGTAYSGTELAHGRTLSGSLPDRTDCASLYRIVLLGACETKGQGAGLATLTGIFFMVSEDGRDFGSVRRTHAMWRPDSANAVHGNDQDIERCIDKHSPSRLRMTWHVTCDLQAVNLGKR